MLTTAQAADLVGLPKEQFRSAMSKERKNGKEFHVPRDEWPDARTPLWDEAKVLAWAKARKKRKKRKKEAKEALREVASLAHDATDAKGGAKGGAKPAKKVAQAVSGETG